MWPDLAASQGRAAVNPIERAAAGLKAFAMRFGSYSRSWWLGWGRTRIDYRAEVGDGRSNSIVEACIGWIQRTFPEAPVRIVSINAQGEEVPQDDHALKLLLDTPNPFYPGELLWSATLADRTADGNAYWLKVRSGAGRVVQLWWVPHTMMEPKWPDNGTEFISHYEYTPDVTPIRIDTADVVHFRWGLDPRNPRKGCSPLKSLLREIFTDDEAGNYTASMLRNTGVPPVVISPGKDAKPTQDELEEVKNTYVQRTTGDQRGMPIVMRGETSIQVLGFNPQQMDMRMARRVPEERVSAVLGIPAAVVGLGTGLENTKVGATMAQMREQAYESNIIPTQRLMGAELRTQLLPDFGDVRKLRLEFDLSQVRVLQADQNDLHTRAREDLNAGGVTVNEFREMIDLEPLDGPAGDVLYVPIGVTPTHPDEMMAAPAPAAPPPSLPGQPAKVHALPARREHKDAGTIGAALRRLRTRLQPSAERDLVRFLAAQAERVVGRLGGKRKADLPTPEELLGPDEEKRLRAILEAIHQRMLQGVHGLVEDALGIAFDLDDATTRAFLTAAGSQIAGITETTRQAVRDALQAGQAEGEGLSELAARIRDLPAFNQARGQLVARTELGHASNLAAVHSYRASGVVIGVRVLDGDFDEACAAMDGRTFTLDEAPAPLQHPNCTRALVPLTDASQLEEAA